VDLRVELLKKTPSEGIRGALTVRLIFSYSLKSMAPQDRLVYGEIKSREKREFLSLKKTKKCDFFLIFLFNR
jgi:hypothetical protein